MQEKIDTERIIPGTMITFYGNGTIKNFLVLRVFEEKGSFNGIIFDFQENCIRPFLLRASLCTENQWAMQLPEDISR